jgi:transcriptional regulator with XRE-family HTH domain
MFGNFIHEKRIAKGLTQQQIQEMTGVKRTYLSKIESNTVSPPSEEVIILIANALDEDAIELILRAGKIPTAFVEIILNDTALLELIKSQLQERNLYESKSC